MIPHLTQEQKEHFRLAQRANMRIEETWSLFTMFLSHDKAPADALRLAREAVDVWADFMDANVMEYPEIPQPDPFAGMGEQMAQAFQKMKESVQPGRRIGEGQAE